MAHSKEELIKKAVEETERRLEMEHRIATLEEDSLANKQQWKDFKADRMKMLIAGITALGGIVVALISLFKK